MNLFPACRSTASILTATALGVLVLACGQQQPGGETADAAPAPAEGTSPATSGRMAEARLEPKGDSGTTGVAHFTAAGAEVSFHIRIENAPPGTHAVHIHEIGDCSAPDGTSAGGHWNPTGEDHGQWGAASFHRGDIGNLVVGDDGVGEMMMSTDVWTLGGAEGSNVAGRAIIVHAGADDFTTQPTGAAGGRIACGVINPAPR